MDMVAVMSGKWQSQGPCRNEDPELFFPIGEVGASAGEQIREAKIVCGGCPVREECLTWALTCNEQGVWGGTTDNERRALKRRAGRTRRGAGVAA